MHARRLENAIEGTKRAKERLDEAIKRFAQAAYQPSSYQYQASVEKVSTLPSTTPSPPLGWIVKDGFRYPYLNDSRLFQGDNLLVLNEKVLHTGLVFNVYEGHNIVIGDYQANTIHAGNGNNLIYTREGDDTIRVGNGNNYIDGGSGKNHIYAGNGQNIYVFEDRQGTGGIQVLHNFHYDSDSIFIQDLAHGMNRDGHLLDGEMTKGGHLRLHFKHRETTFFANKMLHHALIIANFDAENGYVTLIDMYSSVDFFTLSPPHLQHGEEL